MHGTFMYYLPGLTVEQPTGRVSRAQLEERRLWDRLDDCCTGNVATEKCATIGVRGGPDGRDGVLLIPQPHDGSNIEPLGFYADRQTWVQSQIGDYWIGTDNEHTPTPGGLARRRRVEGYTCELGDGQRWMCPTIRTELARPKVPMNYGQVGEQVVGIVQERYQDVWKQSLGWCVRFFDEFRDRPIAELLGTVGAFQGAVAALGVNYRLGVEEATLLGLLNDDSMGDVIDAAIDMPMFAEVHAPDGDLKKKQLWDELLSDWQSSLHGSVDSTPDTNAAEPTSN